MAPPSGIRSLAPSAAGPSSDATPIHLSATEIARQIASRELSAVEAVQAFLARIETVNPRLNAIVVPRYDEAMREAEDADARQARGEPLGPLHGVPITVKECFHLAGTPACIGLPTRKDKRSEHDGLLVRRLRRAGAIVLGKTNVPQLMIWHESDNPVYGRTNNPWNLHRTPGGSTGGEAAIVAARGSALGLGNDLGGSIRVPCHWCGIHGLKPTSHRLPRIGSVASIRGFEGFVTQPGPMARHVEDLWLGLQVLSDDSDGQTFGDVTPCEIGDPANVAVERLRVAMWTSDGMIEPSPAIQRAVREAADALRERGAVVEELSPDEVQAALAVDQAFDTYLALLTADGGAGAKRLATGSTLDWRAARIAQLAGLSPPMRAVVSRAMRLRGQKWLARVVSVAGSRSTDSYWQLIDEKNKYVRHSLRWLRSRKFDAILCPPHALPAPPHETAIDLLAAASHAFLYNILGLPAGVVAWTQVRVGEDAPRPAARDTVLRQAAVTDRGSIGLPVGVQVVGLPWREDVVLAVMRALEDSARDRADYPGQNVVL